MPPEEPSGDAENPKEMLHKGLSNGNAMYLEEAQKW
eukprot:CAMPEP_0117456218 /NCGR_PEP_ID=MMETSP0759-20121206/11764_1 /TAXON_ID=63605 /ORGANISM="Percolomonas cosmopolitus, Strain WS" /LENGTH=35 /DNA_ID= /DNA_START= /DNA_END= /DNA_ORIENTATION=